MMAGGCTVGVVVAAAVTCELGSVLDEDVVFESHPANANINPRVRLIEKCLLMAIVLVDLKINV